jgi:WD40 repeat protein
MSRIFLSHSSRDWREAVALKHWLIEQRPQLVNEIFLDVDPGTGLPTGARWKQELFKANSRCEAVICLLSAAWSASHECRVEYRTAEGFGKQIFCARLEDTNDSEITSEWQRCDLFGDGPRTTVTAPDGPTVEFATRGLFALRDEIRGAEIGASNFVWPPKDDEDRAPYRGWEPLEEIDAGVFFGRDAAIVRGLDELRGMRTAGLKSLFVILGPSGAGKSSFLRAGLLPRLRNEDRRFLPLDIMRPARNALTGDFGLASSIHKARRRLKLPGAPLGEIKNACTGDPQRVAGLLTELRSVAAERLRDRGQQDTEPGGAPTLVLPLDQAEELFAADAGPQASQFLTLLATVLVTLNATDTGLLVAATIRTDRYESMQDHPALAGINTVLFDELKSMPPTQFKEVITGPADRTADAEVRLVVAPDLVVRLLEDVIEGADTLPLLSLTLARLYADWGTTGELTLDQYKNMGTMANVVQTEIDEILSRDDDERAHQLELLRSAFIPWLATINAASDQPMRKVARYSDLPEDSRPLIDQLVDNRLLVKNVRDGQLVVEVALESLLRQWDNLAGWLSDQRQNLKAADDIERNATAWETHDRDAEWLISGTRLTDAETLSAIPEFTKRLSGYQEYLRACRQAESDRERVEEERRERELKEVKEHADTLRRRSRVLQAVLAATALVAAVAAVASVLAINATNTANDRTRDARILREVSDSEAMLADLRPGGDVRAIQEILAANLVKPSDVVDSAMLKALVDRRRLLAVSDTGGRIAAISAAGRAVVTRADNSLQVVDVSTGQPVGKPIPAGTEGASNVLISADGRRVAAVSFTAQMRAWDADSGQPIGKPFNGPDPFLVSVAAFSADGHYIAVGSGDNLLQVWNADTGQPTTGAPIVAAIASKPTSLAFDQSARRVVAGFDDGSMQLFDTFTGAPLGRPVAAHKATVLSVAFSADGTRIATGSADATVNVWNAGTNESVAKNLPGQRSAVNSVALSPDGQHVAYGSDDRTIIVSSVDAGGYYTLEGDHDAVTGVAFSPDGQRIISGSTDKSVRIWNATDVSLSTSEPMRHPQRNMDLVLGGLQLAALFAQNEALGAALAAKTGNPADAVPPRRIKDKGGSDARFVISNTAFTFDHQRYAYATADGTVHIRATDGNKQIVKPLTGHLDWVFGVAFSRDGQRLVSGGADENVRLWNATSGDLIREFKLDHNQLARGVAISPDGRRVVAGLEDGTLRTWDADNGQPTGGPLTGHAGAVTAVAFSPDGTLIVSGSDDKTLRVWDATTGKPVGDPLTGHSSSIYSVAFSSDGKTIVSGGNDKTVRVWDVQSRQPVGSPLTGHDQPISSVEFGDGGRTIISEEALPLDGGGVTRTWPGPAAWADALCTKLTANMTRQQWHDWIAPDIDYIAVCPKLPPPAVA